MNLHVTHQCKLIANSLAFFWVAKTIWNNAAKIPVDTGGRLEIVPCYVHLQNEAKLELWSQANRLQTLDQH